MHVIWAAKPHTAGSDTIFVQIYMDTPPGVPRVSKNQIYFFTNKTVEFLRFPQKDTNFKKSSRLEKMSKTPVFLDSNDPPQKNSESLYCITSYIISCCILGNNERPIDLSRIVKTGRKCSKLVKTGNDLTVGF